MSVYVVDLRWIDRGCKSFVRGCRLSVAMCRTLYYFRKEIKWGLETGFCWFVVLGAIISSILGLF